MSSSPALSPAFLRQRLLVFAGITLGYAAYYVTRSSLTFTAPVMLNSPGLGLDLAAVGAMTSVFPLAYGEPRPLPARVLL